MKASQAYFLSLLVLSILALWPRHALASPLLARIGNANATLQFSPDPPRLGTEHAVLSVTGVSQDVLSRTDVAYSSSMKAMGMTGSAGSAHRVDSGRWEFDVPFAMAADWTLSVHFSGALSGNVEYVFTVAGPQAPTSGSMAIAGGHEDVWRRATYALAIVLFLAGVAAWQWARAIRSGQGPPAWINRSTIGLTIIALVVVLGTAALQSVFAAPSMDMSQMSSLRGSAPIAVTVATVTRPSNTAEIQAPGIIQAYYTQDVAARTSGLLRNFTAYAGDRVRAGQIVAYLDEPELNNQAAAAAANAQSMAASAQAAVIEAQHHAPNAVTIAQAEEAASAQRARYWNAELAREKRLLDNGAVSLQEYQDEQAQAAAATAEYRSARLKAADAMASVVMAQNQSAAAHGQAASAAGQAEAAAVVAGYTSVISPSDAVVVKRLVDPGVYVQAGTPLLRIAVIGQVRIQASIAQEDLPGISIGNRLKAVLPDGSVIDARVTSVQPASDPNTHTALVEAIVPNQGHRFAPGTYVAVTVFGRTPAEGKGASVPSAAIVGSGQAAAVWTDQNGSAHRISVSVLGDDGTTARVAGALKPGDRIVVDGAQDLEEGQLISERSQ